MKSCVQRKVPSAREHRGTRAVGQRTKYYTQQHQQQQTSRSRTHNISERNMRVNRANVGRDRARTHARTTCPTPCKHRACVRVCVRASVAQRTRKPERPAQIAVRRPTPDDAHNRDRASVSREPRLGANGATAEPPPRPPTPRRDRPIPKPESHTFAISPPGGGGCFLVGLPSAFVCPPDLVRKRS